MRLIRIFFIFLLLILGVKVVWDIYYVFFDDSYDESYLDTDVVSILEIALVSDAEKYHLVLTDDGVLIVAKGNSQVAENLKDLHFVGSLLDVQECTLSPDEFENIINLTHEVYKRETDIKYEDLCTAYLNIHILYEDSLIIEDHHIVLPEIYELVCAIEKLSPIDITFYGSLAIPLKDRLND